MRQSGAKQKKKKNTKPPPLIHAAAVASRPVSLSSVNYGAASLAGAGQVPPP